MPHSPDSVRHRRRSTVLRHDDDVTFLITGASGMLGTDLRGAVGDRASTALGRGDLDVTDLEAVRAAVAGHDAVVNCAAYTRVDDAESDEDAARSVNAVGAHNLAIATAETGAALVQVSTDYVFDGSAASPYAEDHPEHRSRPTAARRPRARSSCSPGIRSAGTWSAPPGSTARTAATSPRRWSVSRARTRPSPSSTTSTASRPGPPTSPRG